MKKILFLASIFPKPCNSGGKLRDYYILKYLSSRFDISLVAFKPLGLDKKDIFLPFIPRDKCYTDNSTKSLSLLTFLKKRNLPEWALTYYSKTLEKLIDQIISSEHFDYIHISHSFMAHYVIKYKDIKKVVDHHNVKTNFYKNAMKKTHNIFSKVTYQGEYSKWYSYERDELKQFEHHIACSKQEQNAIRRFTGKTVELVRSGVNTKKLYPKYTKSKESSLLFVGNLEYFPNYQAIKYFCTNCLPLVKKEIPDIKLCLIGRMPRHNILTSLKKINCLYCSFNVEDVRPFYYQTTITIVPLLTGAGTRLKVMEAMAMGHPVVTTAKGCEGLDLTDGEGISIKDSPEDFSQSIIDLLKNQNMRNKLGAKARAIAEERFCWDKVLLNLDKIYKA